MQRTNRPVAYSLIGCVWAGVGLTIAWLVSPVSPVPTPLGQVARGVRGGLFAAPVIGVLIGLSSREFSGWPRPVRLAVALADVYLAAVLFLMAVNLLRLLEGDVVPSQLFLAFVSHPILGALFGLTYTGFIFVLWPLSYANHSFISRTWTRSFSNRTPTSANNG